MIDGRYRLESHLGTGGVGRVYLARHVLIGRRVAIKILQPERRAQSHLRAWFLREARAANRVNHANIVDIHDFGETEDGLAYIVMELLDGRPLSAEIAKGPMPIQAAVDVLEQVCAAIARAHDLGVVHRDIKPENIYLIERAGRKDFVKLLDFGLARLAQDARLAAPGAVFGTPEYMSPEQARGELATAESDLYAVGVVFYEAVTGQLPFDSLQRDTIPDMHIHTKPVPPSQIVSSVSAKTEAIIMRLLAKSPRERYRDAHHLLDELKDLMRAIAPETLDTPAPTASKPAKSQQPARSGPTANVWAFRAAAFGRMVARASAHGGIGSEVIADLERMWGLVEGATQIEAQLASHVRKIEDLERRGREFRGQAGRKIEELSRAQSRLQRRIADGRRRAHELKTRREVARKQLGEAEVQLKRATDRGIAEPHEFRAAAEAAGAAKASLRDTEIAIARQQEALDDMVVESRRLKQQIHLYRERLAEQTDTFDAQLREKRNQLTVQNTDTEKLTSELEVVSDSLVAHLSKRPECQTLIEELRKLEGQIPRYTY
jgi:serine/threonine-protein kinase